MAHFSGDRSDNNTMEIRGDNFCIDKYPPPIVSLAGVSGPLVYYICEKSHIIVYLPLEIMPGDYLLTVSGATTANYALTIGAIGPQGPEGPQGPAGAISVTCNVGQILVQAASGWECRSISIFPNAIGTCGQSCDLICLNGWGN